MIGAGSTGLHLTHLLLQAGHHVSLFERAPQPRTDGCGILLVSSGVEAIAASGDLLLAAGGIFSRVAPRLVPEHRLHDLGDRVWRGVVHDDQFCTDAAFFVYARGRGISMNAFDLDPLPRIVEGRVALLGDAAHAMSSSQARGMTAGLEDALVLARAFADHSTDPLAALRCYERQRLPVVHAYQERSRSISSRIGRQGQRSRQTAGAR